MNATNEIILQRIDALSHQVAELAAHQRVRDELFEDMTPIAREAVATMAARLDALDKQGYLAFASEVAGVGKRIVEGFSPDDVRQLGDAIVAILDVVRTLSRPEILQIAANAADAMREADGARPLGMFGVVRATHDDDVQKGLGMVVDVLRRVGHGINAAAQADGGAGDRKAKLAALLGPRRGHALPPGPAPARIASAAAPAGKPAATSGARCTTPAADAQIDLASWSRELGEALAQQQGMALGAEHWALIDAARGDFARTHASPNIQRLTQVAGITTRQLYQLFPRAPARTIARIAGLPKPAGCL